MRLQHLALSRGVARSLTGSGATGLKDKGDVTPAGEKFCEILRQLTGTSSCITSVKSEDWPHSHSQDIT